MTILDHILKTQNKTADYVQGWHWHWQSSHSSLLLARTGPQSSDANLRLLSWGKMGYLNASTSHSLAKENIFSTPERVAINWLHARLLRVSRYYEKLELEISAIAYFINPINNSYLNRIFSFFLRMLEYYKIRGNCILGTKHFEEWV